MTQKTGTFSQRFDALFNLPDKGITYRLLWLIVVMVIIGYYFINSDYNVTVKPVMLFYFIFTFIFIEFLSFLRYYLILLKYKLPLRQYATAYISASLILYIIPFYLGEVYRYGVFNKLVGRRASLLGILVEKFFDMVAISCIIAYFTAVLASFEGYSLYVFGLAILVVVVIYLSIPGLCTVLNRHIMVRGVHSYDIKALRVVDFISDIRALAKSMMRYRFLPIALLSVLIWCLRLFLFFAVVNSFVYAIDLNVFINHLGTFVKEGVPTPVEIKNLCLFIAGVMLLIANFFMMYYRNSDEK